MPRSLLMILAAAAVVGATYVTASSRPTSPAAAEGLLPDVPVKADPVIPVPLGAGDDPAAAPGPDGRLSLNGRIAFWAARVEREPKDAISLLHLVVEEMAKARLSADLELYQRAGAQLERAAATAPGLVEVEELRAALAYTLHDFAEAESRARPLAEATPADIGALGVLADSLTELGRYEEAARLYDRLSELAPGPALDVRRARFAYLHGDAGAALSLAHSARDAALGDTAANDVAFYHYQLGEMARLTGHADVAGAAFDAAVALRPRDLGSLIGRARVEAAAGHLEDAIGDLQRATAIAPQAESLALLGDLLASAGREREAAVAYDTVRTIERLGSLASSVYDRQLILFELDHGGASDALLARAEEALTRRGDIYGWDVVAWADYRLGRFDAAAAAMQQALATGCRDARLLFHAGAIRLAVGDRTAADGYLRDALSLGPALDPLQRAEAESLLSASGGS